jgi:heme exporter protein CcmB
MAPSRPRTAHSDTGTTAFPLQVLRIVAKDLRVEWRSGEILYTMVLFAVLVVLVFALSLSGESAPSNEVAGGVLWVVVAFTGTLGLGRFFDRERESQTSQALLLAPISRAAIYLGKVAGILVFILGTEAVVVPLLMVLLGLSVSSVWILLAVLLLGSLGFAAVGSLFAAALMRARSRDVLLGILLFPIVTPVIIAGSKATSALTAAGGDPAAALVWVKLLGVFDVVFVTLSMWVFEPLTRGE